MRFIQLANHFGQRYRHLIVAMDGVVTAFNGLAADVDAQLLTVPNRRGKTWMNVRAFRRVLCKLQPDLLVTSNWGSIEWAAANLDRRVPHLHMEDGFGSEEAQSQFPRRVWARRLTLRHSTVVVPSLTLLRIARDRWRLPNECTVYVPNGINCERFHVTRDRNLLADFGIDVEVPVIGTVCTLRPEKNLHRLIDAFGDVLRERPAQLVIVGDGSERASLQTHAVQRGVADRVIFTGSCPTPEKLLPAFSVFAISSDTEQMPLAVLEAMAAGLALAATSVGDIRYMLAEENHPFLVDRDAGRLAAAISMLLNDPARAATVGAANARRAAERFDQSLMLAAYQDLFDGSVSLFRSDVADLKPR